MDARFPTALTLALLSGCGGSGSDVVELHYDTGAIRCQGKTVTHESGAHRMHGDWRFWYDDGQIQAEGAFEDGTVLRDEDLTPNYTQVPVKGRTGAWSAFDTNGHLMWRGRYKEGKRNGEWLWWYGSGEMKARAQYDNGNLVGMLTR